MFIRYCLLFVQEECEDETEGKRGQVVVYVTSVQAVRSTYDECKRVIQILRNTHVMFQQKDIFLHPDYRKELTERLGGKTPTVPQVRKLVACFVTSAVNCLLCTFFLCGSLSHSHVFSLHSLGHICCSHPIS